MVDAWRIVGYENRITSDKSFTQAHREFAEIPAGAATTVFYELELKDPGYAGSLDLGEVELRWVTPSSGESNQQHSGSTGRDNIGFNAIGDSMLQLEALVALSADRYAACPSPTLTVRQCTRTSFTSWTNCGRWTGAWGTWALIRMRSS